MRTIQARFRHEWNYWDIPMVCWLHFDNYFYNGYVDCHSYCCGLLALLWLLRCQEHCCAPLNWNVGINPWDSSLTGTRSFLGPAIHLASRLIWEDVRLRRPIVLKVYNQVVDRKICAWMFEEAEQQGRRRTTKRTKETITWPATNTTLLWPLSWTYGCAQYFLLPLFAQWSDLLLSHSDT